MALIALKTLGSRVLRLVQGWVTRPPPLGTPVFTDKLDNREREKD